MSLRVSERVAKGILTRTSGFLRTVSSHSLQPYRGCTFGGSLCGVGCYVKHNGLLTRGETWGRFLEARTNAAELYLRHRARERRWARRERGRFGIFMSSSTDPFLPQEDRFGITRALLQAMCEAPPDFLILQTHTDRVLRCRDLYEDLARRTELRIHISIESDRDRLPGLPPPASPVARRFQAAATLRGDGLQVIVTAAPLLPIADPAGFFERVAACADAVIVDHFIGGDGSADGARTLRTQLPQAMAALDPQSTGLGYRDRIVSVARGIMPGRVGVGIEGFAGVFR